MVKTQAWFRCAYHSSYWHKAYLSGSGSRLDASLAA
jgi:hypothetical protein